METEGAGEAVEVDRDLRLAGCVKAQVRELQDRLHKSLPLDSQRTVGDFLTCWVSELLPARSATRRCRATPTSSGATSTPTWGTSC